MSGLYNVLFAVNPMALPLLECLKADYQTIDRFRDCFLNETGTEVIIYTRTGGGNREAYAESNGRLRQLSGYLGDHDDPADETYALFRYSVPAEIADIAPAIIEHGLGVNVTKRWHDAIANMRKATS